MGVSAASSILRLLANERQLTDHAILLITP